jgi:mono/diheme cytochrome c family protein
VPRARAALGFALAALAALPAACGRGAPPPAVPAANPVAPSTPAARGRALFLREVGGLSCASCHAVSGQDQPDPARRFVGHSLADATRRPSYHHGLLVGDRAKPDLAILACVAKHQQRSWNLVLPRLADGSPDLSLVEMPAAETADLVAYLETLARPGPHDPCPSAKDDDAAALARVDALAGDAVRGRAVYAAACAVCHGPSGDGGVGPPFRGEMQKPSRSRVVAYCRSGPTAQARDGMDAWMPWFSPDALPDRDLADVAAFLDGDGW